MGLDCCHIAITESDTGSTWFNGTWVTFYTIISVHVPIRIQNDTYPTWSKNKHVGLPIVPVCGPDGRLWGVLDRSITSTCTFKAIVALFSIHNAFSSNSDSEITFLREEKIRQLWLNCWSHKGELRTGAKYRHFHCLTLCCPACFTNHVSHVFTGNKAKSQHC